MKLSNADKPRDRSKLFGCSRFHRAAILDALAVTLLMALMACLGVIVYAASAHADPDDPEVVAYASHYAGAVCSTLADYPSVAGLRGILDAVEDDGLSARQSVQAVALSVYEVCPRYSYLLDLFVKRYGSVAVA
jgi:hypothetical protein